MLLLQTLVKLLKRHSKFVSKVYHSNLSLNEDQMPHDLQLGYYAYWKRYHLKDCLQPRRKDPFQVLLTNSYTAKLNGIDSGFIFLT